MSITSAQCPICAYRPCPAAWRYQAYTMHRCPRCGLEFVFPMHSAPVEYYQENYAETLQALATGAIHPGFRFIVRQLEATRQLLPPGRRRAVDIGCGPGYLLSELERLGFDSLGLDFNPDVVEFARRHYRVNAQVGRIEDFTRANQRFDLALLVHVLEHLEQPLALLRALYAALDPNGLLLIDIPNLDRLSVRRAIRRGELEPGEYPPHHTTFWTRSSLAFALRHAGFEVQHCHAHPLGAEGQIEIFIRNRLRLRAPRLVAALGAGLRQMGRILDWQGEALLALARRPAAAGAAPPG